MDDLFGPYRRTRARVCALLLDADDDELARTIPACPAWSVHDLAAHLVGVPAALAAGRLPSGDVDGWLQEIVDERRYDEVAALVAESGLGALVVEHDGKRWRSHDAEAGWTVRVEPWQATRALYSRRTADELRALPGDGDPEPYLALIDAHLPLPERSLGE